MCYYCGHLQERRGAWQGRAYAGLFPPELGQRLLCNKWSGWSISCHKSHECILKKHIMFVFSLIFFGAPPLVIRLLQLLLVPSNHLQILRDTYILEHSCIVHKRIELVPKICIICHSIVWNFVDPTYHVEPRRRSSRESSQDPIELCVQKTLKFMRSWTVWARAVLAAQRLTLTIYPVRHGNWEILHTTSPMICSTKLCLRFFLLNILGCCCCCQLKVKNSNCVRPPPLPPTLASNFATRRTWHD